MSTLCSPNTSISKAPTPNFSLSESEGLVYHCTNENGFRVIYFEETPTGKPGLLTGTKSKSSMLNMNSVALLHRFSEINAAKFPPLSSATRDLRSPSKDLLRYRAHLRKYQVPNAGARLFLQPIPYSIALKAHIYELVPSLADWKALGYSLTNFPPLLDPEQHPVPGNLTARAQRRRVFEACKTANGLNVGYRCSCSWCNRRRALAKSEERRVFRAEVKEGVSTAWELHWEDFVRARGVKAWWEICCEQADTVDEEDIVMGDDGPLVPDDDNRWAKLVDDAVSVWERKRRVWAEKTGWEVYSNRDFGDIHTRVSTAPSSICSWSDVGEPDQEDSEDVLEEIEDDGWDLASVSTV